MKKNLSVILVSIFTIVPIFAMAQVADVDPFAGTGYDVAPPSGTPLLDTNPAGTTGTTGPTSQGPSGLIPCDGTAANPCEFNDLIVLANNIIKFLMFTVAVPLAALGFMWAGASLVLNQNKESAWSEAKGRFTDIATGFGIMLGAYVLIKGVIYSFLTAEQITFMQFMFQ